MITKACKDCQREKPLDEFHSKSSNPDGRDNRCKECANAKYREYRSHKDRIEHRATPKDKRFFGKKVCNICGKPCRGRMSLCNLHKPKGDNCYQCPHIEKCRVRVRIGIYVLCERPNLGDMHYQEIVQQEQLEEVYA